MTGTPRTCSANFVIGLAGGTSSTSKPAPIMPATFLPEDGIVTHSNHFLTPGHGESLLEKISPNTLHRADRMRHLLREHRGAITFDRYAQRRRRPLRRALCDLPPSRPRQPSAKRTMTAARC